MYAYLLPLLLGFTFNSASAFTTFYSHHLGLRNGRLVCVILRDVLGIPLWALGYIMAAQSPTRALINPALISSIMGWALILAGAGIIVVGINTLRFRAAAPSLSDTLVMSGPYAHIRHPLYSGMMLELLGLFLLVPTTAMLLACSLGFIWVQLQARLEELDLVQRQPAYKEYMQQVPRFFPRLA
jgi:protein-S-isoprenylcysteine O-methyltransferase Ste14